MRVISGKRKGHNLKTIKSNDIRPTEDRVKESVFNILGNIESDSMVLDLFAGTGAIGIEFLSRGAELAYFIDTSFNSIKVIKENLSHTKLEDRAQVYKQNSLVAIKVLNEREVKFDYIYIDPPFKGHKLFHEVLESLTEYPILKKEGLIIIEHEKSLKIKEDLTSFKKIDERKYGNKIVNFLRCRD